MLNALELKIPPLAQVFLLGALMWGLAHATPSLSLPIPAALWISAIWTAAGIAIALAGVLAFRRASTTVDPRVPQNTSSLVIAGIYRRSRNPMYVGFLFALIGWGFYLSHGLAFACVPAFVLYMNRFQIRPEEEALARQFGGEYRNYMATARRWL